MTNRSVIALACLSMFAFACTAPAGAEQDSDPNVEASRTITPEVCNGCPNGGDDPVPPVERPNLVLLGHSTVLHPPRTVYPGTQWEQTFREWEFRVTVKNNGKKSMPMAGVRVKMTTDAGVVLKDYVEISHRYTVLKPGETIVLSYVLGHDKALGSSLAPYKVTIGVDDDVYDTVPTTLESNELDNVKTYDL